jgi:hypothetical protein
MRPAAIAVGALLTLGLGCASNDSGDSSVTLQGVTFEELRQTLVQMRGKVVVLDFWAEY